MDILDQLDSHIAREKKRITVSDMRIPVEDQALFEKLLDDPKITDLTQEIAYLRYLRIKLQESLEARRTEQVEGLQRLILEEFFFYLQSSGLEEQRQQTLYEWVGGVLARALDRHFPTLDVSLQQAAALRDMASATGKIIAEWKKVTDGMTINIMSNEQEMFMRIMREIVIPSIPRDYWGVIAARAEQMASSLNQQPTLPPGIVEVL